METKPLPKETFLELENLSLKLHIAKRNVQDAQNAVQNTSDSLVAAASKALQLAGLFADEWAVDLDKGVFVQKPK